jgi:L-erythro-3,5-diaminohexanoate dehydrogenase
MGPASPNQPRSFLARQPGPSTVEAGPTSDSDTTPADSDTTSADSDTTPADSDTTPADSDTTPAHPATAGVTTPARSDRAEGPVVLVIGAAGKSGSLSLAAARDAGARRTIGVVPHQAEADLLADAGLADVIALADARDPVALSEAVARAGGPADVTVVCVDVPGCEGGAILSTAERGTVVFFSMATSFSAAALGAEGLAADVTMLVGNGYVPGHAEYALSLLRRNDGLRKIFEQRQ